MRLRGHYYDGQSARALEVDLLERHAQVWVRGDDWERCEPLEAVKIGERLGSAARRLHFSDGAHLEVSDHEGFEQWLHSVGYRERPIDLMQRSWSLALASLVFVLALGYLGYRWGLPVVAEQVAERVPQSVNQELARGTLALLEKHILEPSQLPTERQARLMEGFAELDTGRAGRLLIRSAPKVGPNAMALPDGTIILLDQLVDVASHDDEILAVLAHELAHVEHRHQLRLMIQGAAVAGFFAWWVGDFSPLIAGAPVALLQARHSREIESQADAVAARRLREVGIAPSRLADMLEAIEREHRQARGHAPTGNDKDNRSAEWIEYLSSHPATDRRLEYLRDPELGLSRP